MTNIPFSEHNSKLREKKENAGLTIHGYYWSQVSRQSKISQETVCHFKSSRRESSDDQILSCTASRPSSMEPSRVFSQTSLVLGDGITYATTNAEVGTSMTKQKKMTTNETTFF